MAVHPKSVPARTTMSIFSISIKYRIDMTIKTIGLILGFLFLDLSVFAQLPQGKRERWLAVRATKTFEKSLANDATRRGEVSASKTPTERLFFGDFDAPFEFYAAPSFEGAYGCRIFCQPESGFWMFETKRVLNWEEVDKIGRREYPSQIIQIALSQGRDAEAWEEMNRTIADRRARENAKLYRVKTVSFPIADSLARRLCADLFVALATAPDTIRGQGVFDGLSATFRSAADDRVWTLKYHEPDEGDFLRLTELCTRMIRDAETDAFDPRKYMQTRTL